MATQCFRRLSLSRDLPDRLGYALALRFRHRSPTLLSAPLYACLTPDQRRALLLSAGGMKVPQLATHLDCCEATVRSLRHRFAERGLAAVYPQPTGFPPDLARR